MQILPRLILALALLPAAEIAADVPLLEVSSKIETLGIESSRLRAEMSKLPAPGEILQMDAYGYHGGYLPSLASVPDKPRWTLDLVFPPAVKIEKLILVPAVDRRFDRTRSYGFPKRFRISKVFPDGRKELVREWMQDDCQDPGRTPLTIPMHGELAIRFEIEVFRGGNEGEKELFALDEIFGVGRDEIQKAATVVASSEYESLPYWSTQFLIDQKTSLGLPTGVPEPGTAAPDGKDFSVVFEQQPPQPCVVELDLGENRELGWITFFPANSPEGFLSPGFGFPGIISVAVVGQLSNGKRKAPERLYQKWDKGNPGQNTVKLAGSSIKGRWIRISMDELPVHGGKPTLALGEILLRYAGGDVDVRDVRLEGFPTSADAEKGRLVDRRSAGLPVMALLEWVGQIGRRGQLEADLKQVLAEEMELKARRTDFWLRSGFAAAGLIVILAALSVFFINGRRRRQARELRQRITTDLHDDIGSWMSAIGLSTTHLRKLSDDPKIQERCGRIDGIVGHMQSSFQDVLWFTSSDTDSLRQMVSRLRYLATLCIPEEILRLDGDAPGSIPDKKLGVMFKRDLVLVFKEALGNAAKHSEATEIHVTIRWEKGALRVTVADNGKGFDYETERQRQRQRPHLGLSSMERRAKRLGGPLSIDSSPGNGSATSFRAIP